MSIRQVVFLGPFESVQAYLADEADFDRLQAAVQNCRARGDVSQVLALFPEARNRRLPPYLLDLRGLPMEVADDDPQLKEASRVYNWLLDERRRELETLGAAQDDEKLCGALSELLGRLCHRGIAGAPAEVHLGGAASSGLGKRLQWWRDRMHGSTEHNFAGPADATMFVVRRIELESLMQASRELISTGLRESMPGLGEPPERQLESLCALLAVAAQHGLCLLASCS